ncbi:hypothetical protein [Aeromonas hydrophila]|uniref:hypothetical protein n=1 Tax=Aeromonas hydrophila TaxID=644 RepID=UPI0016814CD5|nr:hypothetical protein [Aeromonas hydrophila]
MVILLLLWRAEGYHQSAVGHLSPFIHECRTYYLNSRTTIDADPATINENPNNWAERNYATVLQNHANKMKELPLYSGVSGFFHVNVNGGKCPEFTLDIPTANLPGVGSFGGGQVQYSFCETNMDVILRIIKSVVIVVSTFFAVRYALE